MSEQHNIGNDELELNIDFSKYFKPEVREFFKKNKTLLGFMGVVLLAVVIFGGSKFYNSYKSRQAASINGEAASIEQQNVAGDQIGGDDLNTIGTDQEKQEAGESSNSAKTAIAKLPFTGRGLNYVVKAGDNVATIVKNVCGDEAGGFVATTIRNLNHIYAGQVLEIICR